MSFGVFIQIFKVIKKYNNSNKYAMAVHQLAQAIKQQYHGAMWVGAAI